MKKCKLFIWTKTKLKWTKYDNWELCKRNSIDQEVLNNLFYPKSKTLDQKPQIKNPKLKTLNLKS